MHDSAPVPFAGPDETATPLTPPAGPNVTATFEGASSPFTHALAAPTFALIALRTSMLSGLSGRLSTASTFLVG